MQELIMLIGLPGSGKSTFANKIAKDCENYVVVSTDSIRKEIYGDEAIQGNGNKIFERAYALIDNHLRNGYSVIFDATNIRRKGRKAFIERFKKWKELRIIFHAILVATSYEICLENNLKRRRVVPEEVIKRMFCNFEVPMKFEGWDKIDVESYYGSVARDYVNYKHYLYIRNNIPHDCEPWHTGTISDHIYAVIEEVGKDKILPKEEREFYLTVAAWHDVGKFFVKAYNEKKGRCTYYNHNNTSAYCYCAKEGDINLDVAFVIEKHMEAHHYDSDQDCYNALSKQGIDVDLILAIIRFGDYDSAGALAVPGTELK